MRRYSVHRALPILVVLASCGLMLLSQGDNLSQLTSYAQQGNIPDPRPACLPFGGVAPAGQQSPTTIEPSQPIWCYQQPKAGTPTHHVGPNDWVDTWDNDGPAIQTLNNGDYDYLRYDFNSEHRIAVGGFINVNHWMVDLGDTSPYSLSGGVLLSPNKRFIAENGKLVFETDAAAGSDAAGGADLFYEMDVSGSRPTGVTVDTLYGYGQFGGQGAVGCRFERAADGGHVVCAMYDNSTRDAGGTDVNGGPSGPRGRVWETQGAGTALTGATVQGGYPQWPIPGTNLHVSDVWRMCDPNELDLHCRDRFRMELTQTSIHVFANGYPIYLIDGLTANNPEGRDARIPAAILNNAYVYDTSWINSGQHYAARWHWDSIMINRHDGTAFHAPDAYSSFCLGQPKNTCPDPGAGTAGSGGTPVPVATSTSTTVPTTSPSPTSQATATATPSATATPAADVCTVSGFRNGKAERFPFPCPPKR